MREGVKGIFAVIAAHTAIAHASKWQSLVSEIDNYIVDHSTAIISVCTATIGIAFAKGGDTNAIQFLHNAEIALKRAAAGRACRLNRPAFCRVVKRS